MMNTLTVSVMEQVTLVRYLTVRRDLLTGGNADRALLSAALLKLQTSLAPELARLEVFCVVRALRDSRRGLRADIEALEERRLRGGFNGELDGAQRALDADAFILDGVIRRMWSMI